MTNNNSNAPRIISNGGGSRARIHVMENSKFVTDVETQDNISTEANGRLRYSIVGGDEAHLFTINRHNGVLEFKEAPDFEHPIDRNRNNIYNVKVKVTDGAGFTDTQFIEVKVTDKPEQPLNRPPDALDDSAMTNADETLHFNVLSNDSDPDGDNIFVKALEGEDLDADGNNLDRVIGDNGGEFTLFSDGSLKFDPRDDFRDLAVGESVVTTADYTISDGKGGEDTATISIQVKGTRVINSPPHADNDSATTDEGQPVGINVLANDTDPDGDPLTISSLDTTSANGGTISDNGDGTVTYTPADGFTGTDTFNYHISDGNGGTDDARVTVTVNDVNEAPNARNDSATTDEGQPVGINVLANDTDPDGDPLTISSLDTTSANGGTISDNGDGTVTYTPADGFTGTDTFNYHISDGNGGTDDARVTVTVNDVKNIIEGTNGNDHLYGTRKDDTIKGLAGDDLLKGRKGNDHLSGGAGHDTLKGGKGDDELNGTDGVSGGANELDHLTGGPGMDTFILGDAHQVYYTAAGNHDFARIKDFEDGVDKVRLLGSVDDYHVDGNKLSLADGELIAVFNNVHTIDLHSSSFEFI